MASPTPSALPPAVQVGQSPLPPTTPTWVLPGLAVIILLIYAGALVAVCMLNNDTLRTSFFGSVPVVVMTAVNYYFGSSAGSARKDEIAANSTVTTTSISPTPPTHTP